MNRRTFLKGLGAFLACGVALGCSPEPGAILPSSARPASAQQGTATPTLLYTVATPAPTTAPAATPTAGEAQPQTAAPSPLGARQLTILHTNDSRGYVDPCG